MFSISAGALQRACWGSQATDQLGHVQYAVVAACCSSVTSIAVLQSGWVSQNNLAARFFAQEKEDHSPCLTPASEGVQAPSPAPSEQSQSSSLLGRHSSSLQLKLFSCVGLLETMNKYSISTFTFLDINEVTWPEAEASGVYCKCYL